MLGSPQPSRKKGRGKRPRFAIYLNYSLADVEFAARLAEDLSKAGIPTWFDPEADPDKVSWAGGIHPALEECSHMVVVLSSFALNTLSVERGWAYFRQERKPIFIAQVVPCEIPEELRSRPRLDFQGDYRGAFRQLVQALSS
jgi:hypothetical protein